MLNPKTKLHTFWYPEVLAAQIVLKLICRRDEKSQKEVLSSTGCVKVYELHRMSCSYIQRSGDL